MQKMTRTLLGLGILLVRIGYSALSCFTSTERICDSGRS